MSRAFQLLKELRKEMTFSKVIAGLFSGGIGSIWTEELELKDDSTTGVSLSLSFDKTEVSISYGETVRELS